MKYLPLLLILVCSLVYGADRQNIQVDENWTPKDSRYFMCNFFSKTPKTVLTKAKNVEFERCNFYGCEVDETNILLKSNLIDTTPKDPNPTPEEVIVKKQARIDELERYIEDNNLPIPEKI